MDQQKNASRLLGNDLGKFPWWVLVPMGCILGFWWYCGGLAKALGGDMEPLSAVFSGLAFCGLILTLVIQIQQVRVAAEATEKATRNAALQASLGFLTTKYQTLYPELTRVGERLGLDRIAQQTDLADAYAWLLKELKDADHKAKIIIKEAAPHLEPDKE